MVMIVMRETLIFVCLCFLQQSYALNKRLKQENDMLIPNDDTPASTRHQVSKYQYLPFLGGFPSFVNVGKTPSCMNGAVLGFKKI